MNHRSNVARLLIVAGFAALYLVAVVPTARTYPPFLQKAKQLGYPAQDCTYCHATASGGEGWNERGHWLLEQKKARGAEQVDVSWLKDYKPAATAGAKASAGGKRRRKG